MRDCAVQNRAAMLADMIECVEEVLPRNPLLPSLVRPYVSLWPLSLFDDLSEL